VSAVHLELFSPANSLLTGKNTGKFLNSRLLSLGNSESQR
jgi:hypothetical protein